MEGGRRALADGPTSQAALPGPHQEEARLPREVCPPEEGHPPGEGPAPQLLDEQLAAVLHRLHVQRLPRAMFVPGPFFLDCGGDRRWACSKYSSHPTLEALTPLREHPSRASQGRDRKVGSSPTQPRSSPPQSGRTQAAWLPQEELSPSCQDRPRPHTPSPPPSQCARN